MINKTILNSCKKEGFSDNDLYDAYKIFFGTLVSEPRLKIVNFLREGKKNVSELIEELDMDQTSVSHNLSRLKKCGFVRAKRDGKFVVYELNEETIGPLMEIIEKHMSRHCIHILNKLREEQI